MDGDQLTLLLEPATGKKKAPREEDVAYVMRYVQENKAKILHAAQRLYDHNRREDHLEYIRHARLMHVALTTLDAVVGVPSTAVAQRVEHGVPSTVGRGLVHREHLQEIWGPERIVRSDERAAQTAAALAARRARKAKKPAAPATTAPAPHKVDTPTKTVTDAAPRVRVSLQLVMADGTRVSLPEVPLDRIDALVDAAKAFGKAF